MLVEVSGCPTVVIVVVRCVVSSRWETAALPPLPYTRRCCADDLVSRVAKPSRPFLHLVGLVGSIDNDMSGPAADRREAQVADPRAAVSRAGPHADRGPGQRSPRCSGGRAGRRRAARLTVYRELAERRAKGGNRKLAYFSLGGGMAWNVKGTYLETCSCEFMCPCNFSFAHGADYDRCRVTLVFNVTQGDVEGTDVGGLVVAVIADTPKVMTEGNWRLGLFIDAKASDEQAGKLLRVFSGQLGGGMAALAPLIGEILGVERAPIEVREDGLRHSVRIGDAVDFEIEDVVPFGVETGEPVLIVGMFHPPGRNPRGRGEADQHQRVRHRVRGQVRLVRIAMPWAA